MQHQGGPAAYLESIAFCARHTCAREPMQSLRELCLVILQPAAKQAATVAMKSKPGKRKGPLPLWLAEIIVILGIGGVLFATAKW